MTFSIQTLILINILMSFVIELWWLCYCLLRDYLHYSLETSWIGHNSLCISFLKHCDLLSFLTISTFYSPGMTSFLAVVIKLYSKKCLMTHREKLHVRNISLSKCPFAVFISKLDKSLHLKACLFLSMFTWTIICVHLILLVSSFAFTVYKHSSFDLFS